MNIFQIIEENKQLKSRLDKEINKNKELCKKVNEKTEKYILDELNTFIENMMSLLSIKNNYSVFINGELLNNVFRNKSIKKNCLNITIVNTFPNHYLPLSVIMEMLRKMHNDYLFYVNDDVFSSYTLINRNKFKLKINVNSAVLKYFDTDNLYISTETDMMRNNNDYKYHITNILKKLYNNNNKMVKLDENSLIISENFSVVDILSEQRDLMKQNYKILLGIKINKEDECVICYSNKKIVDIDCGHKICLDCSINHLKISSNTNCPMCRSCMNFNIMS